jgi:hypothetical protein
MDEKYNMSGIFMILLDWSACVLELGVSIPTIIRTLALSENRNYLGLEYISFNVFYLCNISHNSVFENYVEVYQCNFRCSYLSPISNDDGIYLPLLHWLPHVQHIA